MASNQYPYGQLIWAIFDFENDEEGDEHPAIVLADQGNNLAVISGTSIEPEDHLFHRHHPREFTHFWLSPHNLPRIKNGLRCKTIFELVVRFVDKEKVSRVSKILDREDLDELSNRTFIRACFNDQISSNEKLKFGQVICCTEINGLPRLEYVFPAIFISNMKNGKLKVLKPSLEMGENHIDLNIQELISDIDCKFSSKPILIERTQARFLYEEHLRKADLNEINKLPHITVKSKNNNAAKMGNIRVGDVLCADIYGDSRTIETPMLVVGQTTEGGFDCYHVIKGKLGNRPSSKKILNLTLPGFANKVSFDFRDKTCTLSIKMLKYKIKVANDAFSKCISETSLAKKLASGA